MSRQLPIRMLMEADSELDGINAASLHMRETIIENYEENFDAA